MKADVLRASSGWSRSIVTGICSELGDVRVEGALEDDEAPINGPAQDREPERA